VELADAAPAAVVFFLITKVFCLYVFYSWVSLPAQPRSLVVLCSR
jgi:hypothetical protein